MTRPSDLFHLFDTSGAGGTSDPAWNLQAMGVAVAAAYPFPGFMGGANGPNPPTAEMVAVTKTALEALAPADPVESMLSTLTVGLHGAAMACLRSAAHPQGQSTAEMIERATGASQAMIAALDALTRRQAARREAEAGQADAGSAAA